MWVHEGGLWKGGHIKDCVCVCVRVRACVCVWLADYTSLTNQYHQYMIQTGYYNRSYHYISDSEVIGSLDFQLNTYVWHFNSLNQYTLTTLHTSINSLIPGYIPESIVPYHIIQLNQYFCTTLHKLINMVIYVSPNTLRPY